MRRERKEAIDKRKEMIREKKRAMAEKRSKGKAERFLDELGVEMAMGEGGGEGREAPAGTEEKSREKPGEQPEKNDEA